MTIQEKEEAKVLIKDILARLAKDNQCNQVVLHSHRVPEYYKAGRTLLERLFTTATGRPISMSVEPPTDMFLSGMVELRHSGNAKRLFDEMYL